MTDNKSEIEFSPLEFEEKWIQFWSTNKTYKTALSEK